MSPPVVLERGVGSDLDNEVRLDTHGFDVLVAPVPDVAATDDLGPRVIGCGVSNGATACCSVRVRADVPPTMCSPSSS